MNTTIFDRSLHDGLSEKVRYLALDFPKSFLLWTIGKKTTMNKSLKVGLKAESWTYCKSLLKQEKHPYKWSTIGYNSINTGTSENIYEVMVAFKCGPLARIKKQTIP